MSMSRPVGSKNKEKEPAKMPSTVVMPEDLELDRFLDEQNKMAPAISDPDPVSVFPKKTIEKRELMPGEPCKTALEIRERVYTAKMEGFDSIEATLEAARGLCRDPLLEECGYFMFQDIKVYLVGAFEKARARDLMTIEQRNFGKSTEHERREALKSQIKALEAQLNERA